MPVSAETGTGSILDLNFASEIQVWRPKSFGFWLDSIGILVSENFQKIFLNFSENPDAIFQVFGKIWFLGFLDLVKWGCLAINRSRALV